MPITMSECACHLALQLIFALMSVAFLRIMAMCLAVEMNLCRVHAAVHSLFDEMFWDRISVAIYNKMLFLGLYVPFVVLVVNCVCPTAFISA